MEWIVDSKKPVSGYGTWQDALAEAFVRLEPNRPEPRTPFVGRIRQKSAGSMAVSRVEASGHAVHRLREHADRAGQDLAFINLHGTDGATTRQGRRETQTRACDLSVVRTSDPFVITNPSRFSLHCFTVPTGEVPATLLATGALRLSATAEGRAIGRMLQCYGDLALDLGPGANSNLSTNATPSAADGSMALLTQAMALIAWASETFDGEVRQARKRLPPDPSVLAAEICRRAADPALTLGDIASTFGITERRVQQVLALQGGTFRRLVREERLTRAARALAGPTGQSVLEIALSAGFSDLSHFSRCFKDRYGCSPSAYRISHRDN